MQHRLAPVVPPTPERSALDDAAELVRRLLAAPAAGISLADGGRIRTIATRGIDDLDVPREASPCSLVLDAGEARSLSIGALPAPMIDALTFAGFHRYVGAPIACDDGCAVGTVWALYRDGDDPPEDVLSSAQLVGRQVGRHLDAARSAADLARQIDRKDHLQERLKVHNDVLGMVARGVPLSRCLDVIAQHMERLEPAVRCAILIVAEDGRTLRDGAAPSFAPAYRAAIDGARIDVSTGSCGRAAATGDVVLTEDVRTDPAWSDYRELARDHGIVACWSVPVFGADSHRPLGTIALYPDRTGAPTPNQLLLAHSLAELTAIAIERDRDVHRLRRLRQMFDHIGDAVAAVTSSELRFFYVNRAYEQLTGRTAGQVLGRTVGELEDDPANARDAWQFVAPLLRGKAASVRRDRILDHAGTGDGRLTEATATRIDDDLVVVYRDVTMQRRAEATLRRSEQLFRELSERAADGIYRVRAWDWSFDYVNPALADLLGYPAEELCGDPSLPVRCIDPQDLATLAHARHQEDTRPIDIRWRRPDGTVRVLEVRETLARDDEGRLEAILGVAVDVTAARRLEELQHAFLRAISHELRTPLTSVIGYSSTMRSRWQELDPGTVESFLDRLESNANRLWRLLDDLLDVDRLTRSSIEAQRTPTDLVAVATAVADELSHPSHSIAIDGDHFVAQLDRPKVERIIDNMLRNGVRHTPAGTNLRVDVRRTPSGVRLTVEDDGPGVPDHLKPSVFEPFVQGRGARSEASPGTGIGLTLVRKFAQLHGGDARIEDRVGGGARFVVELPADTKDA